MTEYLYDKENPRSPLRNKPSGWESFYKGMPNHYERAEMIARNLLKQTDGDLAKISLDMKKDKDYGYMWRLNKNIARVFKNPIGFATWRYAYQLNMNRGLNPWTIFMLAGCFASTLQLAMKSKEYRDKENEWRMRRGIENWRLDKNSFIDDRVVTGPDTTTFKKHISNFNAQFKEPHVRCYTNPYWCRDQNFRKYFEMRKKNGIEPSIDVSTYYNKDKAAAYWNSHIQMDDMLARVSEIK